MSSRFLVIALAVAVSWVVPAHAQNQPVKLRFHDGLVSLTTQNAPLRAILAEWARLGGTTIVNGDRVTGPPLTLELNAVTERQALDVLLRGVSGYMLATRAAGTPGVAVVNRIMILPTSTAPRNVAPPAGGAAARKPMVQLPQPSPDDPEENPPDDIAPEEDVEVDDDAPVINPLVRPGGRPLPGQPQPVIPEDDVEEVEPDDDTPPGTAMNPFGLPAGASARPGVVAPAPPQQPQNPRGGQEP